MERTEVEVEGNKDGYNKGGKEHRGSKAAQKSNIGKNRKFWKNIKMN